MRVRCPRENCPIDVPDDFAGTKIRCPHCGHLFIIEPEKREPSAYHIQATTPVPKPKPPLNLENQIYDGLPPLSVMIALRRQQGTLDADDIRQLEMTDDDWKALAAFERVLRADMSLQTSLLTMGVTLGLNVMVGVIAMQFSLAHGLLGPTPFWLIATLVIFAGCWTAMWLGGKALARIRTELPLGGLVLAIVAALLILVVITTLQMAPLLSGRHADLFRLITIASIVLNVLSAFDLVGTGVRVWGAVTEIAPPEITKRLVDALKYLE